MPICKFYFKTLDIPVPHIKLRCSGEQIIIDDDDDNDNNTLP